MISSCCSPREFVASAGAPLRSPTCVGSLEYRYDALNRRVFVSALFAPDCGSTCHNYTEQTIWDGDQVLGEIRSARSGFQQSGTIAYTHGGGLDAPLSLVCHGLTSGPVTIVPHSNWRGQYHAGSYTDGAVAGNSRLDLREVRWPAENAGAYLNPLRPFRRDAPWMGSLVQSSEDASGLMYRRNRYYDPKTGRFTQEDPIGLAGGLNTYGFADGDPVSYDDPYGLCPWCAVGIWAMRAAPFLAGAARLAREAADPNPDLGSAIVASGRIAGGLLRNQGAIRSSATRSRVVAQQLNRTGIRLANQLSKLDLTHLRAARVKREVR
jgi:RHS repeat-associated protein